MKSFATSTFDGIGQNMADMLTTGKANWADFTRSTLSMLTQILMKQAMSGLVSSATTAMGFDGGGYTGSGGKYEPAGVVHRGEFVFTKEATSRIGVSNLYRMMKGYATGGLVGGSGAVPAATPLVCACMRPLPLKMPLRERSSRAMVTAWVRHISRLSINLSTMALLRLSVLADSSGMPLIAGKIYGFRNIYLGH
jgi:hypothetical protein